MPIYTIRFADDHAGEAKRVEFIGGDASDALIVVSREAPRRTVGLWEGDTKICSLRRRPVGIDDYWVIS